MNKSKIVYTRIVLDWETGKVIHRDGYPFSGRWAKLKGPTAQQNQIAASQTQMMNTLASTFNTVFANQQGILQSLSAAAQPLVAAGPNQFGFSPMELSVMRGQAVDTTAATFAANQQALNQALAARGGGTSFLPSGAQAQLQQQGYAAASAQESNLLNQITQAGYAQGRQNYLTGLNVLGNVASQYNPNAYAGQAISAGGQAFGSATQIAKEQAAANPLPAILGAAAGPLSLIPVVGPALGQAAQGASNAMTGANASFNMPSPSSGGGGGGDNLNWADISAMGAITPSGAQFGAPGPSPTLTMPTDMGASVLGAGVVPGY
jgi:hypothetical protein